MHQAGENSPLVSLTGLKSDQNSTRIYGVGIQKTAEAGGKS